MKQFHSVEVVAIIFLLSTFQSTAQLNLSRGSHTASGSHTMGITTVDYSRLIVNELDSI